ncbi:MAG: sugar phosphate isomerase/epimerase family protein [Anaerolineae bacterium]
MGALKVGVFADNLGLGVWDGIRKAAELGADGIQIYTTHGEMLPENLSATRRAELRALLADLGLVLSATCSDFGKGLVDEERNRELLPRIKANIDLAVDLGTDIITTHIGVVPEQRTDPVWGTMARALNEIGAYAEERNVVLATETGPEPGARLRELLEALDNRAIRVNFDPANFIIYGYDMRASLAALHDLTVHTHAKDANAARDEVPLGEGEVDFPWYVAQWQAYGYDGFYTIEREVGADPIGDITQAIAFLRNL